MRCGSRRRRRRIDCANSCGRPRSTWRRQRHDSDRIHRRRSARGSGRGVSRVADRSRAQLQPHVERGWRLHVRTQAERRRPAPRGHGESGAADDRTPCERVRCGRADRRSTQRGRPDSGAAARRDRSGAREGDHPLDGASRVEAGRAGTVHRREWRAAGVQRQCAAGHPDSAGNERGQSAGSAGDRRFTTRSGAYRR